MEDLEKRIEKIEERNKLLEKRYRTSQSVLFIVMILALWSVIHQAKQSIWPGTLEAPRVVIEDPDSDATVELDAQGLVFWDPQGVARLTLSNEESGPRLGFRDEKGKWRLLLEHGSDGPSLSMLDENEKWRVHMYQDPECCRLFFCDAKGKPGCALALDSNGPELNMWKEGQLVFEAPSKE